MATRTATAVTVPTPAALGYAMPAEWERHEATWLAWPHHASDWPGKLDTIRWVYGEIVRKLTPGECVRLLVHTPAAARQARAYLARAGADLRRVEFVSCPTNRGWTRDTGPLFVRRGRGRRRELAIVHFHFNGWAKYPNWRLDRKVPEVAARRLGVPLFDARVAGRPFVLEGGGIEVNGRGTLLTTEECLLDPRVQVRNPGLDRAGYEAAFRDYLGVRHVLWLPRGTGGR